MNMVRTRIAPSPTGYPHIGTMYQALFDYAFARKHNGHFVVRIEDTDRERFVPDAEERIFAAFDWFGLREDESPRKGGTYGPYRQSERLDIYKKYALELVEKGGAYYCFCTKERLEEMRRKLQEEKKQLMYDGHCRDLTKEEAQEKIEQNIPWVIRLRVPRNKQITVNDAIRGEITFDSNTIDDQVLLKSDGFPTYHLAVVIDDHLMEITHVVRGEEWITSAPKHDILYDYFGWEKPLFFHTPLLRNPDKSKLSKRHGHTNVVWYQEEGFLPEAILNFLALLGWSHPQGEEVFSLETFTELFELKDLKPVGPIFDLQKLLWINGEWIRGLSLNDLKKRLQDYYRDDEEVKKILVGKDGETIITLAQTRMKSLKEFKALVLDDNAYQYSHEEKEAAKKLTQALEEIHEWKSSVILDALKAFKEKEQISMKTIYVLITGKKQGLPLTEMMEIHGKDAMIKRVNAIAA